MNVVLIPMRGGSKSIPKKNIKMIADRPLCDWVIKASINAKKVDEIYVSTDCEEIAEVVKKTAPSVKILGRSAELATDEATTESVILDFMNRVNFDILVTVQATSPLLTGNDIDSALEMFEHNEWDSMLTAVRVKRFFWYDDGSPVNYSPSSRPRRQDFKGTLMENGAFYLTRKNTLEDERCRLGGKIGIYEMSEETAVEIDEPEDWARVEKILLSRTQSRRGNS